MEYKLLICNYQDGLTEKVNEFLADGWELYGSPGGYFMNQNSVFFQAVIGVDGKED